MTLTTADLQARGGVTIDEGVRLGKSLEDAYAALEQAAEARRAP